MQRWYAARVRYGMELAIVRSISALGFSAYSPHWTMADNRSPVFPAYVFAQFDVGQDNWEPINQERGVVKLLPMHLPYPSRIQDKLIEQCRKREDDGDFIIRGGRLSLKYNEGERVTVTRGNLRDLPATFKKQERSIATLIVTIFNVLREVTVPAEYVGDYASA